MVKKYLKKSLAFISSGLLLFLAIYFCFYSESASRAWDGSGHQAIAQIYSHSIFPDSFGWSHAYFSGMPFPNFYPPVFYWLVGLFSQTLSFESAFKLIVFLPVFLLPLVLWNFIYSLTDKNRLAAWAGAIGSAFLLLDSRFIFALPAGLDFFSTFQIGLYTQPLGFIFLLLWYLNFTKIDESNWRFVLSAILLALTVLTNFFAGTTATLMAGIFIIEDAARWRQSIAASKNNENKEKEDVWRSKVERISENLFQDNRLISRRQFSAHFSSCLIAFFLTLFWVVPMVSEYQYFVTRPYIIEANQLLSPAWWIWFALAIAGFYIWYHHQTRAFISYTVSCLILGMLVALAAFIAPDWVPLQSARFLAMLNFFLVVPVGLAIAKGFRWFAKLLGEIKEEIEPFSFRRFKYTLGVSLFLLAVLIISSPGTRMGENYAFISEVDKPEIWQILNFAKDHTDGRYLVEVINPQKSIASADAAFDARAINSYLGSNGNETVSAVFHEASPHALFTLPVINSLSDFPDSFGISSILSDDLDFQEQPIEKHLDRAKFLGVKYLVIRTPAMKDKLSKVAGIENKYDFGWWTVYQLPSAGEANPVARILPNRPALVVSDFTLKARYRNDLSYVRFVEEQFNDDWFDVLLARSLEMKIERLTDWENFGAVIINNYQYADENAAFEKLKEIAQKRLLILISDENPLYRRILQDRAEFPKLEVIERPKPDNAGEMLKFDHPTHHYNPSPVRQMWRSIRQILETNKVPIESAQTAITGEKLKNRINSSLSSQEELPVLISNTFHPNWSRDDGDRIYPATPFYQLTFANRPISLNYRRSGADTVGFWISAATLISLLGFGVWLIFKKKIGINSEKGNSN